jgi:hypothetical protein
LLKENCASEVPFTLLVPITSPPITIATLGANSDLLPKSFCVGYLALQRYTRPWRAAANTMRMTWRNKPRTNQQTRHLDKGSAVMRSEAAEIDVKTECVSKRRSLTPRIR